MSTVFPTKQGIERNWHVVDANDVVLGKLASHAARLLMGKHKTTWTPFIDTGDHVVVINAEKVKLTGKKDTQKLYRHFTGYPGGLVETGAFESSGHPSGAYDRGSDLRHAAQDETRQADVSEAESLRR